MHALIIEDEILVALNIETCLRGINFDSFAFSISENQAVLSAVRNTPDLIVADFMLTAGNGASAVLRIAGALNRQVPPVLFVTANKDVAVAAIAGLEPAFAELPLRYSLIAKPFEPTHLRRAAVELLDGGGNPGQSGNKNGRPPTRHA